MLDPRATSHRTRLEEETLALGDGAVLALPAQPHAVLAKGLDGGV